MPNPKGNPNLGKAAIAAGTTFSSTNQPEGRGPKPSRIRAFIQENDLGTSDIAAAIRYMAELTEKEMIELGENQEAPFLLRSFAAALMSDAKKGILNSADLLLNRALGKPKESLEVSGEVSYEIKPAKKKQDAESND